MDSGKDKTKIPFAVFSVHPPKQKTGTVFQQRVIPPDAVNYILTHLDRSDIKNLNITNRYFHGLIKYDTEDIPLPPRLNIYKDTIFDDPLSEIDIERTMNRVQQLIPDFNWNDGPYYFKQVITSILEHGATKWISVFKGFPYIGDHEDTYIKKIYYNNPGRERVFVNGGVEMSIGAHGMNQLHQDIEDYFLSGSFEPFRHEDNDGERFTKIGIVRLI